MAQWVAFALLLGIPAWWFFVGNGPRKSAEDTGDHPVGFFRLASVEVDIPAGPDTLDLVEAALEEFWSQHGQVSPSVQMEIGIAAAELAGNIVEHGNAEVIRMHINLSPCQVHVDFTDDGGPVEVDLGSVVMPGEFAESGRGLAIVKSSMSRLSYERERLLNRWTFVSKEFDRTKAAQEAQV